MTGSNVSDYQRHCRRDPRHLYQAGEPGTGEAPPAQAAVHGPRSRKDDGRMINDQWQTRAQTRRQTLCIRAAPVIVKSEQRREAGYALGGWREKQESWAGVKRAGCGTAPKIGSTLMDEYIVRGAQNVRPGVCTVPNEGKVRCGSGPGLRD